MPLKVTTWNINSVRLRIDLVAKFLKSAQPDVLCLQETKCPDDAFPLKRFKRLGYEHVAINGQKGYHGVAVVSRAPFERIDVQNFCGKTDCRHISVVLGERAGLSDRSRCTISMCRPAATSPIPRSIRNSRTSSRSSTRCARMPACSRRNRARAILVGDLNVAPLEHDVWSHKQMIRVVSHTPVECEKLVAAQKSGGWIDCMRVHTPGAGKALHVVELSRDGQLARGRPRPQARPRLGFGRDSPGRYRRSTSPRIYRGAERPSDHVPVTATIEV